MLIQKHQEVYGNTIYTDTALENNDNIIDFPADHSTSNLLKFKQQVTGQTGSDDT